MTFTFCSIILIPSVPAFTYTLMHKLKIIKQHFHYYAYVLFNAEPYSVVPSTEKEM